MVLHNMAGTGHRPIDADEFNRQLVSGTTLSLLLTPIPVVSGIVSHIVRFVSTIQMKQNWRLLKYKITGTQEVLAAQAKLLKESRETNRFIMARIKDE